MTLISPADPSAPRHHTLRGVALLASASMVAAISLLAVPLSAQAATAASLPAAAVPAAAVPAAALPAVAVGKLPLQGCTAGTATATCELYAMAGTTSMNGGAAIPIWGFSSSAAGRATAPGPLLVVNQGDTVSVTLHNQLGEAVSLAFPGQPSSAFSAGLSATAEDVGAAPNTTVTYTFKADRAGTFLYEAGHTAHGTRQVAMGLSGALVVRPADGTAYGVTAGYPSTAYQDEAVLVLSEIDPAFNACPISCATYPLGFDMRSFAPKYRLINGKPFPSTDPISTDQGHQVLLRYVNAGTQDHSMSLLGSDQLQVAQDGHAMKYAETEVTMALSAGATADTLATMPSGPESKIALYEAGGHLDNNGQTTTASGLSLAFGGMLTFLDTAAPQPSTDVVGPVSSHVAATPNPSNGQTAVTVTADLSDATTGGSNVDQAEIVIDDASPTGLAPGFGTPMTAFSPAPSISAATGTISQSTLAALAAGKHTVFVRAHDTAGNWGVVGSVILNLPKTGPQTTNGSVTPTPANGTLDVAISATGDDTAAGVNINGAEYFLDTVGANGSGIPITPNRLATVVSLDAAIPAATVLALGEGVHHVYVHSRDTLNLWGPTLDIPLPVDLHGPGVDGADVAPNPTNGVLTGLAHPGYLVVSATITDPNSGGVQNPVTDAEGFLDTVGTAGTGFQLAAVDGSMNSTTESVTGLIPISQVRSLSNGTHHVYVHGQDAAGNWGPTYTMNLIVDKVPPVLAAVVGTPNPTLGAANLTLTAPVSETTIGIAEFWLGATDPGVGKGTSVAFSLVGTTIVATVPLTGILPGAQRFNLRVKDLAGSWSNAVNTTVTVSRPNAIFSDGFNNGSLAAWSARTGAVSATANAGIGIPAGTTGLQVFLPGNVTNQPSFVTDSSPTAETAYHASFAFNANTLNSGTNANSVLTLFEAQGTAASQVLAVQFHRTLGAGGVNQIRMVFPRSTGGTFTGPWVNLPAGSHTIRVDWVSGPATGANAGSLRLSLDGVSVSFQTGNTGTRTVETALLGLTAGVTSTMGGTAYFDSFVSTRYTLP